MQIVIDIPDQIYDQLIETGKYLPYQFNAKKAIKEGIPLPKGHGDLVDRNDLLNELYVIDDYAGNEINIVDKMTVEMVDAIIEADKE